MIAITVVQIRYPLPAFSPLGTGESFVPFIGRDIKEAVRLTTEAFPTHRIGETKVFEFDTTPDWAVNATAV